MKTLVSAAIPIGVVAWSLLAWGAYALIGWAGGFIGANADALTGHPETVEWLSWAAGWLTSLGLAGVVAVWLLGLVLLAALAGLIKVAGLRAGGLLRRP